MISLKGRLINSKVLLRIQEHLLSQQVYWYRKRTCVITGITINATAREMNSPHKMPLEVPKLMRWNRDPLRTVKINRTPVTVTHWTGSTAGITFEAWRKLVYPEFPTLSTGHLFQLVEHLFITFIYFNLVLMNKCFYFNQIRKFD